MDFNKELLIRANIIIFGIVIIIYGFYLIYSKINPVINGLIHQNLNFEMLKLIDINLYIYLIIIGYIIYFIGRNWKKTLKKFSELLISVGIIFLTFFIVFYVINSNSNEIINSIQPSIDTLIMSSIEPSLNTMIEENKGKSVNLILSQNTTIKTFYLENLSQEDANFIINIFDIPNLNEEEKIIFSKFIISTFYTQIIQNDSNAINVPIPITSLKNEMKNQGIDFSTLQIIDISILKNIPLENNAFLKIMISENDIKKKISIGNIENNNIELIWENLNLNPNISFNTKNKTINLLLSQFSSQMNNSELKDVDIPISTIGTIFPEDIKNIFNYDFLSENLSDRVLILNEIRNNCNENNNSIYLNELCDLIRFSEYEYFMKNIDNFSKENNLNISNSTISNLKNYDELSELKNYIEEKTNSYLLFSFLFIIFISLSILSYYFHFKLNKEEYPKYHIFYFISKINLYKTIPMVILTYIFYYIITKNVIIDFIKNNLNPEFSDSIVIVTTLPIYNLILELMGNILILNLFYFGISILLFSIFHFLLKKELK